MRGRPLQVSLALPLICLATWVTVVLVPTTFTFLHMKSRANSAGNLTIHTATIEATIPRENFFPLALHGATIHTAKAVAGINIPAFFVEAGLSLLTSWPHRLYPSRYLLESWRALVFPIYALPAWWYVGRGMDGFLARRRLGVVEVIFGLLVSFGLLVLAFGFQFGLAPAEREPGDGWLIFGFAFWALLAAIGPMGWLRQRRKSFSNHPIAAA